MFHPPRNDKFSWEYLIKIVIIGDSKSGKTSLVNRYCDDHFSSSFITTIGIDFKIKTIEVNGIKVKVQLWDTAGQERFRTLTKTYWRGANGVILVFDCSNRESFEHLESWFEELNLNTYNNSGNGNVRIICSSKIDLPEKTIGVEELANFAKKYNCKFYETSSKLNVGIDNMFEELITNIVTNLEQMKKEYYEKMKKDYIILHQEDKSVNHTSDTHEKKESEKNFKQKCCK